MSKRMPVKMREVRDGRIIHEMLGPNALCGFAGDVMQMGEYTNDDLFCVTCLHKRPKLTLIRP